MHMLCSMRVMVVHHAVKAFMLLHHMRVLGGGVSGDEGIHCCCTTTTTTTTTTTATTTTGVCPGSHQIQSQLGRLQRWEAHPKHTVSEVSVLLINQTINQSINQISFRSWWWWWYRMGYCLSTDRGVHAYEEWHHDGAQLYCTLLYLQWIGRLVMMNVVVVLEEVAVELVHHAEGLVVEGYGSELLDVYSIWRRWWL